MYIVYRVYLAEGFSNRDKAESILEWFNEEKNPKYSNYQYDVKYPDIVEYNDVKKLHQNKKLTVDNIMKVL